MQDIPSDAEVSDGDDDADDSDLLEELAELGGGDDDDIVHSVAPPTSSHCVAGTCAGQDLLSVIESRILMYAAAEQV